MLTADLHGDHRIDGARGGDPCGDRSTFDRQSLIVTGHKGRGPSTPQGHGKDCEKTYHHQDKCSLPELGRRRLPDGGNGDGKMALTCPTGPDVGTTGLA